MKSDSFGLNDLPSPHGSNGKTQMPDFGMMIRSLVAETDMGSRAALAALSGLSFGGVRDLYATLGYDRVLNPQKLRARYDRGGIAARIVEAYPKATWRGGAELIEDEDPEITTMFEEEWTALDERLHVWPALQRADILAGLGPFSLVLIGAAGELNTELPKLRGQEAVLYLTPYGPSEVEVDTYVEDFQDPRFGLPLTYALNRAGQRGRAARNLVHWTRVVHAADNLLDDRVCGNPLLHRVWNLLDDLDKVVGGGSEAYWRRVHQGTILNVKDGVKAIADQELKKLKDETDEFIHGMKRFLTLRGVEMEQMGSDVSNFNQQVESIISLVSGATGIPQRILLGSERGELASTQDKENWDERVSDRRRDYADPLVRQLTGRLVDHGALPKPDQYRVQWPEVDDLTMEDRADVADKWSKLNSQAGDRVVTGAEIRDKVLGLEPLPEEEPVAPVVPAQPGDPAPAPAPDPEADVTVEDE